jgi:hypothetical protein
LAATRSSTSSDSGSHTEIGPDGRRRGRADGGAYTVDETAIRHGAGIEPGTAQEDAYARFPPRTPARYGGWLDDAV